MVSTSWLVWLATLLAATATATRVHDGKQLCAGLQLPAAKQLILAGPLLPLDGCPPVRLRRAVSVSGLPQAPTWVTYQGKQPPISLGPGSRLRLTGVVTDISSSTTADPAGVGTLIPWIHMGSHNAVLELTDCVLLFAGTWDQLQRHPVLGQLLGPPGKQQQQQQGDCMVTADAPRACLYISSSLLAVPGGSSTIHLRSTLIVLAPAGGVSWTPGQQVAHNWGSLISALQQQTPGHGHGQANPRTILYLGDSGAGGAGASAALAPGRAHHLRGTAQVVGCSTSSLLVPGKLSQVRTALLAVDCLGVCRSVGGPVQSHARVGFQHPVCLHVLQSPDSSPKSCPAFCATWTVIQSAMLCGGEVQGCHHPCTAVHIGLRIGTSHPRPFLHPP